VDTITGGAGADQFTFTDANQSNTAGSDVLVDYLTGTDKIVVTLDQSNKTISQTFDAVVQTAAAGVAAVQSGLSGSLGQAIFDKTNNQLIVNANADNLVTTLDYVVNVPAASTVANSIVAGDVNFVIKGSSVADFIVSGSGADTITSTGGADTIDAGAGDDTVIISTSVANTLAIKGGTGNDTLTVLDAALNTTISQNVIKLGTPADNLLANAALTGVLTFENVDMSAGGVTKKATIFGTDAVNIIKGTAGTDLIMGLKGADIITGGAGIDTIRFQDGDEGGDTLDFSGADVIQFTADDIAGSGTAQVFDEAALVLANTDPTNIAGAVVALNSGDYNEIAAGGTSVDNKVNIITTAAGYSTLAAAIDAPATVASNGATMVYGFFNSANAVFEVHYVANIGTSAANYTDNTSELIVSLTGLAAAGIAAGIGEANFGVFSLG